MGLKRSLVSVAVSVAFAATALVSPADASPAHGGSYAASVATTTNPTVKINGSQLVIGSRVRSTSSAVVYLHGSLVLKVVRSANGHQIYSATKTVNGKSGAGYWSSTTTAGLKKGVWYRVYATFTAKSGHIEKSSSTYKSFKF